MFAKLQPASRYSPSARSAGCLAGCSAVALPRSPLHALRPAAPRPRGGFTLLELMIVVGIMGIILTMGVPLVYKTFHKAPMAKALKDIVEVCSHARGQAIMQAREVDMVLHPREYVIEIAGAAPAGPAAPGGAPPQPVGTMSGSGFSAVLPKDRIAIQALGINLVDYTDAEIARVRFYPNGTSDELLMILQSNDGEQRGISLEVTTGLASVLNERDLQDLRRRLD